MDVIRKDFDRIAQFEQKNTWSHTSFHYPYLLEFIPVNCRSSLEIGCGNGDFTRLLASRSQKVVALDLSPEMIRRAKEQSTEFTNIEYLVADILETDLSEGEYDCIATIATLHHLPLEFMLANIKRALMPGGVLLVLDLYKGEGLQDIFITLASIPLSVLMKRIKNGHRRQSKAIQLAWKQHGRHDHYLPVSYIRKCSQEIIPGAVINKHLFWRYSLIWEKSL